MKRAISILCLLIFANVVIAHPLASGGGTPSSSEETDLTLILTITVVVGVATLLLTDILSDNSSDSQDEIAGVVTEEIEVEETGVNWNQINQDYDEIAAPLLAISIFPSSNGRELAIYFTNLIQQGNSIYYNTYHSPVSFGSMKPEEAASTGFTFLDCTWYLATDSSSLQLFKQNDSSVAWSFEMLNWDSVSTRSAATDFIKFTTTN